jgi:hypothetical protein
MNKPEPLSSRERVARRRAKLRAQGLRPKQVWVLDLSDPEIREQIRQDCARIAASRHREEDIAFAEALQYWPEGDRD